MANAVQISDLSYFYGTGGLRRQVLCDLSLSVREGEIVILTGPSGSGKTTLLSLLGGLRTVQAGQLCILGADISAASVRELYRVRRQLGFIFQASNLHRSLTVLQNVVMGLEVQQHHRPAKNDNNRLGEVLNISGWPIISASILLNFLADKSRGWLSRERWFTAPSSSLPMNQPRRSINRLDEML